MVELNLGGDVCVPPPAAVPSAVSTLTDDLLKYYQHVTRAVLGDDPQLMKVRPLINERTPLPLFHPEGV